MFPADKFPTSILRTPRPPLKILPSRLKRFLPTSPQKSTALARVSTKESNRR